MVVDFIENSPAIGHPHMHGSDPLISAFVAHVDISFSAVIAAGKRRSAPSALGLPVEREKTLHCTGCSGPFSRRCGRSGTKRCTLSNRERSRDGSKRDFGTIGGR